MSDAREADRKLLTELGDDRLLDLFFHQIRNIWRVDGLYFLGMEKRHGAEAATEVDTECWGAMAGLEARGLKKLLDLQDGLLPLSRALRLTSWALDHKEKELEEAADHVLFRVINCRTQRARASKGLEVFPCRQVRQGYLEAFAKSFGCGVECLTCPPGERQGEIWCEWRFVAEG